MWGCHHGNAIARYCRGGVPRQAANPSLMSSSFTEVQGSQATDAAVLSRIVVPFGQTQREDNLGGVRGMAREYCAVPFPPGARVVQAEKTEGAWVVWYVEGDEAI